jgi:hypothetical protein
VDLRWIVVPAKVIPHAMASAQWGWRLPWRKLLRMLLELALVARRGDCGAGGRALPGHFFNGEPHGTVAHQVWAVILKLAGAYLLAIASWVLLLAWAAVLLARTRAASKAAGRRFARCRLPVPGPLGEDSVALPLPESGDDSGGNI